MAGYQNEETTQELQQDFACSQGTVKPSWWAGTGWGEGNKDDEAGWDSSSEILIQRQPLKFLEYKDA